MTKWRWGHLQFSKEAGLSKRPLKAVGMAQFKKDLLHANDGSTAGATKMPNCCFMFWEMGPAGLWPKCSVPCCWQEGDGAELWQIGGAMVHGLWAAWERWVTRASLCPCREDGKLWGPCSIASVDSAAPHTCTDWFRWPPGLAVAV